MKNVAFYAILVNDYYQDEIFYVFFLKEYKQWDILCLSPCKLFVFHLCFQVLLLVCDLSVGQSFPLHPLWTNHGWSFNLPGHCPSPVFSNNFKYYKQLYTWVLFLGATDTSSANLNMCPYIRKNPLTI